MKKSILLSIVCVSLMFADVNVNKHNEGSGCTEIQKDESSCSKSGKSHKKLALVTSLPHPMKMIIKNAETLKISDKQMESLAKIIEKSSQDMHPMFDKVKELESSIKKDVVNQNKTKTELKSQLDTLEKLKRKITETQIDRLNELHTILSKEQRQKVHALMKEHKK